MAYRQWMDKLQAATDRLTASDYIKIHSESLVGLLTCIFVKASERDRLRDADITTVKRGFGSLYGNKVGAPFG